MKVLLYSAHPKFTGIACVTIVLFLMTRIAYAQERRLFELLSPQKTGIAFKNIITEDQHNNALTYENLYNGGGVGIGDLNNDGLEDIYFISNMKMNKLYLNLGDFRFRDITKSAGVAGREGWKTAVTMADINGDGLLDIYVCYSGKNDPEKRRNQLFINRGDLTFEEKAKAYGLDDPSYSTHAAFLDYDRDGDLDLFLLATNVKVIRDLEFEQARKEKHPYAGDKLFRNDGERFTEVTESAGILSNALGFGLGVAVSDLNKDGWPDLYVSNDYIEPDYLYINNGNGTFTEKLTSYLQHISYFSMGCDVNDINNDAWPDIYTADMLPRDNTRQKLLYGPDNYEQYALMIKSGFHHQCMRNMLHLNNADGTFSEIGQLAGVSNTDWSWAPLIADYDNDGWKDLFVSNGYFRDYTNRDFLKYKGDYYFQKAVAREKPDTLQLVSSMTSTPLHNYIFRNNGNLTFADKSTAWGLDGKGFSNGAAYADLDNDGDLDLVVNNQNESASVYKNLLREYFPASNYVKIKLKGAGKNTSALGSKVYAYMGGTVQYLEQSVTRGYQSSVSHIIHFGLGAKELIDSLRVEWPGGSVSIMKNIKAGQLIELAEAGDKERSKIQTPVQEETLFSRASSPVAYKHVEYGSNDFKRQPLLMTMLSACGPVMATADVNGDGLTDVYVGGVKGSPGNLFFQTPSGGFRPSQDFSTSRDLHYTDADALFFDADQDKDLDLYIASGGYHDYRPEDPKLQDRLYLNQGGGRFLLAADALPVMFVSKSCVRSADLDGDGDHDLFVGGRVIPGKYPEAPESFLLLNDGNGKFTNEMKERLPALSKAGMVTDAVWVDLNKDTWPDLVVVGEFMPVSVFLNEAGKTFTDRTTQYFEKPLRGLWTRLAATDFDRDGDTDLVAGNFGWNTQFRASEQEPVTLVFKDFDKNGSIEPFVSYYIQGRSYPFAGRDDLLDQMYGLRKKFTTYASYSKASLTDIFSEEELKYANTLSATSTQSVYFENTGSSFVMHALPVEAQFAPVYAIEILDYNDDSHPDLVLAGNQSAIRVRLGAVDANHIQLYQGDGRGGFRYVPQVVSGFRTTGDVKALKTIRINEAGYLLVGINNAEVEAYKLGKVHNSKRNE